VTIGWDQHTERSLLSLQDALVRAQVRDLLAPFSPLWHYKLSELGLGPADVVSADDLEAIPALGERDISPDGDAAGMSALVVQVVESGPPTEGGAVEPRLGRRLRPRQTEAYRPFAETDSRATSYVFAGLGFRYPIASTRRDLDSVSLAGEWLWEVLGLTRDDVLISAVPVAATTQHLALQAAALRAGSPAIFPGAEPADLVEAVRLAPPTVLALPSDTAADLLGSLRELATVRTLLLVGAPTDAERRAAAVALFGAGGDPDAVVLAVHAPSGARVLWGECRESAGTAGLHAYPDLDIVQVIDPETGLDTAGPGEVVLTQLGLRGSALLRWRTGDLADGVEIAPCSACGRVVPRVMGVRRGALVAVLGDGRRLDLRAVAGVLTQRPDIEDWRLVVGPRARDDAMTVVVHLQAVDPDDAMTVIRVASDLRAASGTPPTQLVAAEAHELAALTGFGLSERILLSNP
jgi:phenylacetate-coenzyme A ligase PaaK-like adenylate-forming protein